MSKLRRKIDNLYFFNDIKLYLLILIIIAIITISFMPIKVTESKEKQNHITNALLSDEAFKEDEPKKLVAFTFDDGPSKENTTYLLKELEKRNAHVSFFIIGDRIKGNEYLIKQLYNDGHTIGSHTFNHKNLKLLKEEEVHNEINETNKLLTDITGHETIYLRPPYGSYNNYIFDNNMVIILWSIDTLDWQHKDAEKIKETIVNNVQDCDIILLHDLYPTSIEGALLAMDELKDEYDFVSIDELINKKEIKIEPNTIYNNFRSS